MSKWNVQGTRTARHDLPKTSPQRTPVQPFTHRPSTPPVLPTLRSASSHCPQQPSLHTNSPHLTTPLSPLPTIHPQKRPVVSLHRPTGAQHHTRQAPRRRDNRCWRLPVKGLWGLSGRVKGVLFSQTGSFSRAGCTRTWCLQMVCRWLRTGVRGVYQPVLHSGVARCWVGQLVGRVPIRWWGEGCVRAGRRCAAGGWCGAVRGQMSMGSWSNMQWGECIGPGRVGGTAGWRTIGGEGVTAVYSARA